MTRNFGENRFDQTLRESRGHVKSKVKSTKGGGEQRGSELGDGGVIGARRCARGRVLEWSKVMKKGGSERNAGAPRGVGETHTELTRR